MAETNYTVYKHTTPSGKVYIGITRRQAQRRWGREGKKYEKQFFGRAVEKYGWDNIDHVIVADHLTKDEAFSMERELIKQYRSQEREFGYNITPGGESHEMNEVGKRNVSLGLQKYYENPEAHRRVSEARKQYYAEHPEAKELLRQQHLGMKMSDAARDKMSARGKGRQFTEETRKKISESQKGWNPADDTRRRMSEAAHARVENSQKNGDYQKTLEILSSNAKKKQRGVIATNRETGETRSFESISDASTATNVKMPNIIRCCKGGRPTAGGYFWRYAAEEGDC